jgi:uncharacterized protein YuzE
MKIQYFQDTDTLYIEFKRENVAETRDLDENTLLDVDDKGNIVGITVEHASQRADIPKFSYEQVPNEQTAQILRERRADYGKQ